MTRVELVKALKQVLADSGVDMDNQIRAVQELRGSLQRRPASAEFAGPIAKPGNKGKKKQVED